LRGVILEILPEKQSLLVHHEEIPGVMRAMTMLLKVDPPTLAAARKNQRITATLTRRADGWWLTDVAPASAAP
jgi:Cu/Ag efflux protein CusF